MTRTGRRRTAGDSESALPPGAVAAAADSPSRTLSSAAARGFELYPAPAGRRNIRVGGRPSRPSRCCRWPGATLGLTGFHSLALRLSGIRVGLAGAVWNHSPYSRSDQRFRAHVAWAGAAAAPRRLLAMGCGEDCWTGQPISSLAWRRPAPSYCSDVTTAAHSPESCSTTGAGSYY